MIPPDESAASAAMDETKRIGVTFLSFHSFEFPSNGASIHLEAIQLARLNPPGALHAQRNDPSSSPSSSMSFLPIDSTLTSSPPHFPSDFNP